MLYGMSLFSQNNLNWQVLNEIDCGRGETSVQL